ncbi:MFS transporter [Alcaligenes faecalis]|uniref:MFS transporter n=1 Tax=Alcaligenes TaxID=507 RepID=UPI00203DE5FF|nr:MFS transporter [Alcaligenes faecalis]MCM2557177.1 MFS transporter [Alcaligenes faecalis]MCM2620681.1 MFS transporter [Alcaligenes faecalis]MDK7585134.1 MFS transporter [Alcaligenes phenolicus]
MENQKKYFPGQRYVVVFLLFLFMVINFADKAIFGLVAVPLMEELAIGPQQFGTIAGSFFFLFAISGIVVGFVSNTVSSRLLLVGLVIIWSVAQVPIAMGASTIVALMACRILLGVGEGPAYPLALHACYKWFPDQERTWPTAIVMQGGQVGMLLAGPLVGYLTISHGWRSVFWVTAAAGLMWLVVWALLGKDGPISANPAPAVGKSKPQSRCSYRDVLLNRSFIGNLLMYWVAYWCAALVFTWLPAYLQRGLNFSSDTAGWLFSLCIFVAIPIVSGGSYLSNRFLRQGYSSRVARSLVTVGFLLAGGLCLLAAAYLKPGPTAGIVLIALGLSFPQVGFVLCSAISAQISPIEKRGSTLAITNSLSTTAGLVAPIVMGRLIQAEPGLAGFHQGFALTAVLLLLGAVLGFVLVDPSRTLSQIQAKAGSPVSGPASV